MKTILVCIISEQLLPNYLYLVEKAKQADELLLVTSKKFRKKAEDACEVLETLNKRVRILSLSDYGVEEKWNQIIQDISVELNKVDKYLVNLTGGTKYLAMAVQKAFEGFDSEFFYIPFPKNYILGLMQEGPRIKEPIRHRVGVTECLSVFGAEVEYASKPLFSEDIAKKCLNLFRLGMFTQSLFFSLERQQRNLGFNEKPTSKRMITFLDNLQHRQWNVTSLLKKEVAYLKGGWFEEYIYYLVKRNVKPDEIALNLKIDVPVRGGDETIKNELDVCFTRNNRFFVIECKAFTGTHKKARHTVFKSKALKESILGMAATSYICAIGGVKEQEVAIKIDWFGGEYFLDLDKTKIFINKIIESSSF